MPKRSAENSKISLHERKKARRHRGPPDTESESDQGGDNHGNVDEEQELLNLQDELAVVGSDINELINQRDENPNNASGSGTNNNGNNDQELKRKKELQIKITSLSQFRSFYYVIHSYLKVGSNNAISRRIWADSFSKIIF